MVADPPAVSMPLSHPQPLCMCLQHAKSYDVDGDGWDALMAICPYMV